MNIAASLPLAASAKGSTAHMRLPRWSDEPVDLIPVMIFLDIVWMDYVINIRKKEEIANANSSFRRLY